MADLRTCPRDGCTKRISGDLFACSRHWYSIPEAIRDDIWRAFRAYNRGAATLDELLAAQAKALEHWGQT